jgi:hypothetical protein
VSATTADTTFAMEGTAVAIEGSDAGEGGDLAARERTELGEIADQAARDAWADAGHRDKEIAFVAPGSMLIDRGLNELLERSELAVERFDDAVTPSFFRTTQK